MRNFQRLGLGMGMFMICSTGLAQKVVKQASKRVDASQSSFSKLVSKTTPSENTVILNRFITTETDSIQKIIRDDKNLSNDQKAQALSCQCSLLDTLQSVVSTNSYDIELIKEARDNFIPVWQTILTQKSTEEIMGKMRPQSAALLATVFKDNAQFTRVNTTNSLKDFEKHPETIMQFLANNPTYEYKDSLIFILGNTQPDRLLMYLNESRYEDQLKLIREHKSPLIQMLVTLSKERNLKNYLPFVGLLTEQKITLADIDKLRAQPSMFYKTIVDAEISNQAKILAGEKAIYVVPTQKYLAEYAKMFFTDIINSLHESPEKVRFEILDDMRPQDLYYMITTGEDELFTSSYLYLYKKVMSNFDKGGSDQLLDLVKYDQYRQFLVMAGRYNTLASFLKGMPTDKSLAILRKLFTQLDEPSDNRLGDLISVAETFPGIVVDDNLRQLTATEIETNLNRYTKNGNKNRARMYQLLTDMFGVVEGNETGNMSVVPQAISVYFRLSQKTLIEKDGKINQLVLFFGDDDGKASYASFLSNYSDGSKWTIEKNASWAKISSKKGQSMSIYANLPLDNDTGEDLKAQEALSQYLKANHIEPHMLILRGHSYHLVNAFKFFSPSIQLGILGSCGGYTEIIEILNKSPHVQVISTKQIGSKQVNEPMLKMINDKLLAGQDLVWSDMWDQLETKFKGNKLLYDYFKEYVPPYKNIALLVTALYNQSGIR